MTSTAGVRARWHRVVHLDDAEEVRRIRNEGRLFMTRHTDFIEPEQQAQWFGRLNPVESILLLFNLKTLNEALPGEAVAYGFAQRQQQVPGEMTWWLTGCVAENWRRHGFGRYVFQTLLEVVPGPHWLEVRESNVHAHALYKSLGFQETSRVQKPDIGVVLAMRRDA